MRKSGGQLICGASCANRGDTTTMPGTLTVAAKQLAAAETVPTAEAPAELVADKGYHSRDGLKGPGRRPVDEPHRRAVSWRCPALARRP
jgi:hypothetical protein